MEAAGVWKYQVLKDYFDANDIDDTYHNQLKSKYDECYAALGENFNLPVSQDYVDLLVAEGGSQPAMSEKARVKIRRGEGWDVKPDAEVLDGQVIEVSKGWSLTEDESSIYVGEDAYIIDSPKPSPILWLASGDLEFLDNKGS